MAGTALGGYDGATWGGLATPALGPTALGCTAMNDALRYLHAHEVNVSIFGEPIGAALWATRRLVPGEMTAANL
ncbi:MAG: hypothetical protein ACREMK_01320 [Gemmatimonadota bacterium]